MCCFSSYSTVTKCLICEVNSRDWLSAVYTAFVCVYVCALAYEMLERTQAHLLMNEIYASLFLPLFHIVALLHEDYYLVCTL